MNSDSHDIETDDDLAASTGQSVTGLPSIGKAPVKSRHGAFDDAASPIPEPPAESADHEADEELVVADERIDHAGHLDRNKLRSTSDSNLSAPPEEGRVRIRKHRKNADAVPEWERDESAEPEVRRRRVRTREGDSPRAGTEAAPGDEEADFDHEFERAVVKKRRVPTRIEKVFLTSPKLMIVAMCVVLAVIVVAGIYGPPRVASQAPELAVEQTRAAAAAAEPPEEREVIDALLPNFLTAENETGAVAAINAYLGADGWQAKSEFVRRPAQVRPLMAEWYAEPGREDGSRSLSEVLLRKQAYIDGRVFIMIAGMVEPFHTRQFFAVEKTEDGEFLVDWEVTEGYQPMSLEEFQRERPSEPVPFRVSAFATDFYNGYFDDPERYLGVRLVYPGRDFYLYGYARRNSSVGKALDERMLAGNSPSLILGLRFNPQSVSNDQVEIVEIVAPNWFR